MNDKLFFDHTVPTSEQVQQAIDVLDHVQKYGYAPGLEPKHDPIYNNIQRVMEITRMRVESAKQILEQHRFWNEQVNRNNGVPIKNLLRGDTVRLKKETDN